MVINIVKYGVYQMYDLYIYMYTLYLNLGGAKVDDCGEKYWKRHCGQD